MDIETSALCLAFSPLVGSLLVGLFIRYINAAFAQCITISCMAFSTLCAMMIFKDVVINGNIIHVVLFQWVDIGLFQANWSIFIDVLTSMMLILITIVSLLVHIYSVGYMSHDPHRQRFMSYLSLFTFCMIALVTSDNFLQMFFGWEGVGLASYLLIGFWFKKASANNAAMKAFIVNRVGDFGFALGIFICFWCFGSIEFENLFASIPSLCEKKFSFFGCEILVVTLCSIFLFIGAMGKSAQFGLHVWLPDAMEGPTPVSALIHAATMVTAGVFMVARCSPIFEYSKDALNLITCVGAFTCLFAASVALVQNDIKKIIAYSTCSQLGYMFFACGVSAYSAAIFHLLTHGFFKALLFLSAGSVIHAMSGEQDIRKMGGIWKTIPFTYSTMWIGSLALAGVFPFAGFYSKDVILESAMASGSPYSISAYWIGLMAAVMTAFYSWRLLLKVFHGPVHASKDVMDKAHESPVTMLLPIALLSVGSVVAGMLGYYIIGIVEPSYAIWGDALTVLDHNNSIAGIDNIEHIYAYLPILAGMIGIISAYILYSDKNNFLTLLMKKFHIIYKILDNKWYIDEIYHIAFVRPMKKLSKFLSSTIDTMLFDSLPNGFAYLSVNLSKVFSVLQSGFVYHYIVFMVVGLIALLTWIILIF